MNLFDVQFSAEKRLVDHVQALPDVRAHRLVGNGFNLCQIPQALRCLVCHGAVPPVQNPSIPPVEEAGCRA